MKRFSIYTLVFLALASVSCSRMDEEILVEEAQQEYMVISARTESDAPETKTYLGPKDGITYPVYWSTDDKIGLVSEEGISEFTLTQASDKTHATFGGNASGIVGKFPRTMIFPAAYPSEGAFAEVNESGDAVKVGTVLPTIQTLVNNLEGDTRGFDNNTFPMAAASTSPTDYQFYNLAGILRLKIYYTPDANVTGDKAGILRITLKGNDREILSGPVAMEFNPDTGAPITSTVAKDNGRTVGAYGTEGKEKVIIDLSACERTVNGQTKPGLELPSTETGALEVNLAVIPQTFDHGFTIEIMDASTMGTQVYKSEGPITIERSKIKEMTAIDYVKPAPLEVANCYITSEPGEYMMPAFAYGNRMGTNLNTIAGFDASKNDVDILWTDIVDASGNKIDAVTEIDYMKFADGNNYVSYRLNEESLGKAYRGNVVLALYNEKTKEIYWTWHLWLTDQPQDVHIDGKCAKGSFDGVYPDGTPYHYEAWATYDHMQILDRNLGAIHALPSECDDDTVNGGKKIWQTYGLYYQDGRRDPFIGGDYNGSWNVTEDGSYSKDSYGKTLHLYEDNAFDEGTHATWTNPMFGDERGWKCVTGALTIPQTLNCPQKYSYDSSLGQWVKYSLGANLVWMDPSAYSGATHGNTGLLYGDHEAYWNRTKTIFDPCPPGYSVLGERGGYFIGGAGTKQWYGDDTNGYGLLYSYDGETIWWPAAGVRTTDGKMAGVGKYGFYFFYDHIDASHGGHGFGFKLSSATSGSFFNNTPNKDIVLTNHATTIRCVKALQDHGSADLADPKK